VLTSRLLPCLVLVALTALTSSASAREDADSWFRAHHRAWESPQRFAFELRFGPYRPRIDDAFPGAKPYESVFGSDRRVYFGLEFDWQVLRIPMLGTVGPGIGWGYTHMGAQAKLVSGADSAEETTLALMPMYGVGVLRVDVLARETTIPLVAYGKAGIGCGFFSMGNDLGTQAKGHTWGTHYALGGMLLLDAFDEHAAIELDNEMGINNTYVYFEWMIAQLDGFGRGNHASVLNIGTSTWVLGLAFEI